MAKSLGVRVEQEVLDSLFHVWRLWDKIESGMLSSEVIPRTSASGRHQYAGGESAILRHRTPAGTTVAATHRIIDKNGAIVHWHPKTLRVGDVTLYHRRAQSPITS